MDPRTSTDPCWDIDLIQQYRARAHCMALARNMPPSMWWTLQNIIEQLVFSLYSEDGYSWSENACKKMLPYCCGLDMKSMCAFLAFAARKVVDPNCEFSWSIILTSWGLNKSAARCSSGSQFPLRLLWASTAGTQPSGPVPVTWTWRAPISYSLCNVQHVCDFENCLELEVTDKWDWFFLAMETYRENLLVLGDQVADIVRQGKLTRACRVRHQVVVVNKVVASEGDENECSVHEALCLRSSDQGANPLLVLLKVLQLHWNPNDVDLHMHIFQISTVCGNKPWQIWGPVWQSGITNWTPVSLRIPIPADAKLAPTSNLCPRRSGLRYGNVGSAPRCSPEMMNQGHRSTKLSLFPYCIVMRYLTDNVRDVEPIGKPAGRPVGRVINAVRGRISTSSGGQVVVVAIVDQRITKHEECTSRLWGSRKGPYGYQANN